MESILHANMEIVRKKMKPMNYLQTLFIQTRERNVRNSEANSQLQGIPSKPVDICTMQVAYFLAFFKYK
jgi:hypothetical protein